MHGVNCSSIYQIIYNSEMSCFSRRSGFQGAVSYSAQICLVVDNTAVDFVTKTRFAPGHANFLLFSSDCLGHCVDVNEKIFRL